MVLGQEGRVERRSIPRLYAVVDAGMLRVRSVGLREYVTALRDGGVELLQYRNKIDGPEIWLRDAETIADVFAETAAMLVMNDRADIAVLAEWDAVHLGQQDLSPADARRVVGATRWVGISTHNEEQVRGADIGSADYIAIGPVFETSSKTNPDPVVGLDGVRRAREITSKPLVAIGGITPANAREVLEAGADSVAVVSALLLSGESPEKTARDFLAHLR